MVQGINIGFGLIKGKADKIGEETIAAPYHVPAIKEISPEQHAANGLIIGIKDGFFMLFGVINEITCQAVP